MLQIHNPDTDVNPLKAKLKVSNFVACYKFRASNVHEAKSTVHFAPCFGLDGKNLQFGVCCITKSNGSVLHYKIQ
jgi:hypothetical protein